MVGVGAGRFGEFGVRGVEASGEREGEWRNKGREVRTRKGECGKECGTGTWEGARVMGRERMGLRGTIHYPPLLATSRKRSTEAGYVKEDVLERG